MNEKGKTMTKQLCFKSTQEASIKNKRITNMLPENEERLGQYATKRVARMQAKVSTQLTGLKHIAISGTCYRLDDCDVITYRCWTVVLTNK